MRKLSANVINAIARPYIKTFCLVKIEKSISDSSRVVIFRSTNAGIDIVVPGDGLYEASDVLSIDPPRVSDLLDRAIYKISFIDPLLSKRAIFEGNLNGSRVKILMGFYNTTDAVIDGIQPGQPMTNPQDISVVYAGFVDTCKYTLDTTEETVIAEIECNSPMSSLNLERGLYTSREEMRSLNANDSSFDQSTNSSGKMVLVWGIATNKKRVANGLVGVIDRYGNIVGYFPPGSDARGWRLTKSQRRAGMTIGSLWDDIFI